MGTSDVDTRIAARLRASRAAKRLSLEDLAASSGVSRAMLSRIERAESSATARLLVRVCAGLGISLSDLLAEAPAEAGPVARRAEQPVWRDPGTGYRRRAVSPPNSFVQAALVEVELPARARVALDNRRYPGTGQHVWLLSGALDVTVGRRTHRLAPGDCLSMRYGTRAVFRNPGRTRARYAVIHDSKG